MPPMSPALPGTLMAGAALALAFATSTCAQPAPAVKKGDVVVFGDWRADAPGVRHQITVSDLPPPGQGTVGQAKVVPPAAGALPKVPAGFAIAPYASGLQTPRAMRVAPNGDVFVAEQDGGRIKVLRAGAGGAAP